MYAFRQARHLDSGPRRSVSEFEALRIVLVHDPRWNVLSQVGIYENHVAEVETRGFEHGFHTIESEIYLRRRIVRNLAGGGIAAEHGGYKQTVVSEHSR